MNGILWPAVILLAVTAGILSAFLHGYRRQVRALKRQMDFLKQTDTSLQLSTTLTFRDVDALAVDINEALDRHRRTEQALLRVSRNYKDTITSISHDLRTPLTSASGYLQMLRSPKIPAKKREQYLRVIDRRIGSVQKLLDQLFEFARIEADELVLESKRLPVNNVLRDAVSLFYDDFCQKGAGPSVDIPDGSPVIFADQDALRRVFANILQNALVHGDGEYRICSQQTASGCRIRFENATHTIEEADLPHLFDRFYTTDRSRSRRTTGLGLSIAKKLTERMGGTIEAALEASTFVITVTFPNG